MSNYREYAEQLLNEGVALANQGRLEDAAAAFGQALQWLPGYVEAHSNLGTIRFMQDRWEEAIASYQEAVRLEPDRPDGHVSLGLAYQRRGALDEAIASYQRALQIEPDFPDAWNNLGTLHQGCGALDEAMTCFEHVLRVKPDYAEMYWNVGGVLLEQLRFEEALARYKQAVHLRLDSAEIQNGLGYVFTMLGRLQEAEECLTRAIRIKPDYGDAHYNLGRVLLARGDFARGWPEFEWRWRRSRARPRRFSAPRWAGQRLDGKTVLLHGKEDLSNTIQFLRYVSLVHNCGGRVVLECHPALMSLAATSPGIDQLVPTGALLPAFDVEIPLLALPGIFRTSLNSIPAEIPYLAPPRQRVEHWRNELASERKRRKSAEPAWKVGIIWQGATRYKTDTLRWLPLAQLAPFAEVDRVAWFSLQTGQGSRGSQTAGWPSISLSDKLDTTSLEDLAAVLVNLDLLITVDVDAAHLAGALGVPVWLALPYSPDWRWLMDRYDSPWYPSMRLFRQHEPRNWSRVVQEMVSALRQLVNTGAPGGTPHFEVERARLAGVAKEKATSLPDVRLANLNQREYSVYSQNGEDGILAAIFATIGVTNRFGVEFGCQNASECNTAYLQEQGWRVLLMDGIGVSHSPDITVHKEFITAENINELFSKYEVPRSFDLLSIDIDGNDYWVWSALQYRPRVVVVEYNSGIPPQESKVIAYEPDFRWKLTDYFGASLRAFKELGEHKGYTLVACDRTGTNAFFVANEALPAGFVPRPLEEIYSPPRDFETGGPRWWPPADPERTMMEPPPLR